MVGGEGHRRDLFTTTLHEVIIKVSIYSWTTNGQNIGVTGQDLKAQKLTSKLWGGNDTFCFLTEKSNFQRSVSKSQSR